LSIQNKTVIPTVVQKQKIHFTSRDNSVSRHKQWQKALHSKCLLSFHEPTHRFIPAQGLLTPFTLKFYQELDISTKLSIKLLTLSITHVMIQKIKVHFTGRDNSVSGHKQ